MQKCTFFSFMMFPERFEPGNLTESTTQKYISKSEGLKPISDLTMINFDDPGTISGQKTFWKPYSFMLAPSSRVSRDHENALIHHRFSTSGDSRLFILTDNIKWILVDNPTWTGAPEHFSINISEPCFMQIPYFVMSL